MRAAEPGVAGSSSVRIQYCYTCVCILLSTDTHVSSYPNAGLQGLQGFAASIKRRADGASADDLNSKKLVHSPRNASGSAGGLASAMWHAVVQEAGCARLDVCRACLHSRRGIRSSYGML
jgi:hypothetical protein